MLCATHTPAPTESRLSDLRNRVVDGGYDLGIIIEGRIMKEVAYFVSQKLAPIDEVLSTATHFVLRKYKDKGVIYGAPEVDERGNCL